MFITLVTKMIIINSMTRPSRPRGGTRNLGQVTVERGRGRMGVRQCRCCYRNYLHYPSRHRPQTIAVLQLRRHILDCGWSNTRFCRASGGVAEEDGPPRRRTRSLCFLSSSVVHMLSSCCCCQALAASPLSSEGGSGMRNLFCGFLRSASENCKVGGSIEEERFFFFKSPMNFAHEGRRIQEQVQLLAGIAQQW